MNTDKQLTPSHSLVLELVGASITLPPQEFGDYCENRLKSIINSANAEYLQEFLMLCATMAGSTIQCWAEDTNREHQDILLSMRKEFNRQSGL